jgi:hypothetical protein
MGLPTAILAGFMSSDRIEQSSVSVVASSRSSEACRADTRSRGVVDVTFEP